MNDIKFIEQKRIILQRKNFSEAYRPTWNNVSYYDTEEKAIDAMKIKYKSDNRNDYFKKYDMGYRVMVKTINVICRMRNNKVINNEKI